ncbi:MAG: biotin transporter BioY [Bdellovibrio sp.]|nr:biotin transporter BioY [Bdellovibrio sp.]
MNQIQSQAVIPFLISGHHRRVLLNVLVVIGGSLLLALLAQVSFVLPFTPVPITGQTFGVAVLALGWGRKRALASFALYLSEGALGLPFFALGKSGLIFGPTIGYLLGMFIACGVVGHLADKGYAKTIKSAFACCLVGSCIIFSCGLIGLSFFVPAKALLVTGLLPFIPGDLIKSFAAASVVSTLSRKIKQ